MLPTSPLAMTSASPSFAQQMPIAPALCCSSAMRMDLCVLVCGRRLMPHVSQCACMFAMFALNRC